MKKELDYIVSECVYAYEQITKFVLAVLIIITSPIWVVPYILYWKRKFNPKKQNRRATDGKAKAD